MNTPSRLTLFAILLATGCAGGHDHEDDPSRLAVVATDADGFTLTVGSYDAGTGELTFLANAQDDLREQVGAAGHRALVGDAGDLVEVDLEAGVAVLAEQLEEGDALELRIAAADLRVIAVGRLVLHDADALDAGFRMANDNWKIVR
jgi:hypothetical protein